MSDTSRHLFKWPAALLLAALFLMLTILGGCSQQPEIRSYQGMTMGTGFTVKWVSVDSSAEVQIPALISQTLVDVNNSMSTYQSDSELSQFNRMPAGSRVAVSDELAEVVSRALEISRSSNGAFDVTVGPLVNLWGFGPDGRVVKAPSDQQISDLQNRIGYRLIDLQEGELAKHQDIYLDLSAIAKGYGVDRVALILEQHGISSYLVEIGGELRARGLKPDGSHWKIAIEAPVAGERKIQRIIAVKDVGIASSGDYRNYFEEDGIRFSHTIDPLSGKPISHKLASVTVLAQDCASADGLATAMMVMGPDKAMAYAVEQGVEALLIVKSDQGFEEQMTPGFSAYLVQ